MGLELIFLIFDTLKSDKNVTQLSILNVRDLQLWENLEIRESMVHCCRRKVNWEGVTDEEVGQSAELVQFVRDLGAVLCTCACFRYQRGSSVIKHTHSRTPKH